MSDSNLKSFLSETLLQKTAVPKVKAEITSNLDELFREASYESYVLELKKAILIMERSCPKEITTPFKGNCLAVSNCGKLFVFGSIEGRIAVVDKDSKEILHDVLLDGGSIYAIALYKDDKHLISAGKDGVIREFDYNTFEETRRYLGHEKEVNALVLSPDNSTFYSASDDFTVRSWAQGEDRSKLLYTHDKAVLCLDINEEGNLLISGGSDKKVKILDLTQGTFIGVFSEFNSSVWSVKISAANKYFAAGDSNATIKLWDLQSLELVKTLVGHTKRVSHLEFTKNQQFLVSSSNDCTLRIWDIAEDKNETILTGHTDWIKAFKISDDEKSIYSIAENFKIMTWKFPKFDSSCRRREHSSAINSICYSRTNNYIFTSDPREIKVWDIESKSLYKTLVYGSTVSAICMNFDNKTLMAAYTSKEIVYWSVEDSAWEVKIKHPSIVKTLVVSPDGRFIVCGDSNFRVTIYSRKSLQALNVFRRHNSTVNSLVFSKPINNENDQFFSGGEDCTIYMYAIKDNKSFKLSGHTSGISFLAVSRAADLLVSGDSSGCFKIWHILKQACIRTVTTHTGKITGIYFNENSKYFWISSEDCTISLWNSTSFTEVTNLKSKYPISCFVITKAEAEIVTAEYEDIMILANPLKSKDFYIYGPGREYYSFMRYIVQICEGNEQEHNPEMDKWIITPFEINALHFYAYFNLPNHLRLALRNNSPFYFSKSGYSPIQIALHRNFRDCINVIIKSIRLNVREDPYSVGYLEDSIVKLNEMGFRGLDEFYNSILFKTQDKLLPKFVDESIDLPILIFSRSLGPQQKDFFDRKVATSCGTPVSFWQSALKIDVVIGSKDSISFLESIVKSPNANIFTTSFIKELVLYKWKYVKWILLPQAFLYLLYMIVLSEFMIYEEGVSSPTVYVIFTLNIMLTCYEIFQISLTRMMYLQDVWNYIDWSRIGFCSVYCIFVWANVDDILTKRILVCTTFLSMLRGISYFRLFDNTRYMINLLSEVFKDMSSFLILLAYSTYSFALIYFVMINNLNPADPKSFSDYIKTSYLLNLGDFDTEGYGAFEWLIFFFASVINPLIMLNLLISIMGDTYERVEEEQEIADMKELTEMVVEGEYLLFCKRNKGKKSYMQICKQEDVSTPDLTTEEAIDKLKNRVKKIEQSLIEKNDEIKLDIKDAMEGVNSKLDEMTTLIEQISLNQD